MSKEIRTKEILSWRTVGDYVLLLLGGLVQALAMRFFLVPSQLLSGGVSGIAQIINSFTNWPIGVMVILGNLPLFFVGWRYLGRARFAMRTGVAIAAFSIFTDLLVYVLPNGGLTDDLMLSSIFGGVIFGFGLGLVYRAKGTSGGSDIIGQILYHRRGISMTQAYFAVDALVLLAGGLAWSWEQSMYSMIVMYVSSLSSQLVFEGPGILRTVMIISVEPDQIAKEIMTILDRGVTVLPGTGAYTGQQRPVLYCVVNRSEVNKIKSIINEIDQDAFIIIGDAHEALGHGFKPLTLPDD